jgi:membrane associated rhomboid family serine protease
VKTVMERNTRSINAPNVVLVLLGLFAAVHVYKNFLANEGVINLLLGFAFIPARYGGDIGSQFTFPYGILGDLWTPVTYMFLHADITHLLVNGFWMLAFGSLLARRFSTQRFLLYSLLCGIAGALAHLSANWGAAVPMIGASAAISGLMAGAARFIFSTPMGLAGAVRAGSNIAHLPALTLGQLMRTPPALIFLGIWLAINLLFGLGNVGLGGGSNIAWEAHIGGFVAGLFGFDLFDKPPRSAKPPQSHLRSV